MERSVIGMLSLHTLYKKYCEKSMALKPGEFVILVANLLKKLGGDVDIGPKGADGGIDLWWKTPEGKYIIQCKSGKTKVDAQIAREIYGVAKRKNEEDAFIKGSFIVTTSEFTKPAIGEIADVSPRVGLIDGEELFYILSLQIPTVVDDIRKGLWGKPK